MSAWPHGDPDAVAKAIVAQPAYHAAPAPATSGFLRFWYEFWDLVDRLLRPFWTWLGHALTNTRGVSPLAWFLIGLTVVATVVLIVRIVLGFVTPAIAARRTALDGGGLDERRSADEWQRIATGAAAAGEYARAIAALFAAALAALDERMLVPFDPSRTPGEYRRLVRDARDAADAPFSLLADRFVRAVYAAGAPQRADYDAALGALMNLKPLVSA